MTLTQKRLKELFYYDPVTGVFTRLHSTSNVKAGRATGNLNTGGHLGFLVDKKMYQAHRLAWLYVHGDWPNSQIDHINGVRTDNRIENLRDVPHAVKTFAPLALTTKLDFLELVGRKHAANMLLRFRLPGKSNTLDYSLILKLRTLHT